MIDVEAGDSAVVVVAEAVVEEEDFEVVVVAEEEVEGEVDSRKVVPMIPESAVKCKYLLKDSLKTPRFQN